MKPALPRVHAITDERIAALGDLEARAEALAAAGGAKLALHARGRALPGRAHAELARRLTRPPALLFVNDRLDVALAAGAAGVQLGAGSLAVADARRLGPEWLVGVSVHSLAAARAARAAGADYLLAGPAFPTATHPGAAPLGARGVAEFLAAGLPVIAIGGVTAAGARELRAAGVYGVAAIRALWDADDPSAALGAMLELWNDA